MVVCSLAFFGEGEGGTAEIFSASEGASASSVFRPMAPVGTNYERNKCTKSIDMRHRKDIIFLWHNTHINPKPAKKGCGPTVSRPTNAPLDLNGSARMVASSASTLVDAGHFAM